jgi:small conductance mechanosensitive channel
VEQSVEEIWTMVVALVTTYGLGVIGAIVILIVGFVIAGWVRGSVKKALSNFKRVDETLRGFFSSLAYYAVIVFTIIAVLSQFGVETTSFIAVLGAAGLAIGLALQGTGAMPSRIILFIRRGGSTLPSASLTRTKSTRRLPRLSTRRGRTPACMPIRNPWPRSPIWATAR